MKASELFIKCLENEGVRQVYGVPGEENVDILEALRGSKINFVTTRHEQGAAFMADVEGRLTGNVGVCLSTLGPGATNLITGVADAFLDRAPLLAITGQASRDRLHKESHQYIDIISLFKPLTKWNAQINTREVIAEVVRKAFKVAHTEKPGAVHIDVPEDVMEEDAEGTPMKPQYPFLPEPLSEKIKQAVSIIGNSKKPAILAGNGAIRLKASESLKNFARKLNIPVVSTYMGKGNMPDDEELSLFTTGIAPRDHGVKALRKADLIIAVGYDLVEFAPRNFNPFGNKKIIHIDATPAEVDSFYEIACGVLGDIVISLSEISASCRPFNENWALDYRKKVISEIEEHASDGSMPVKPQRLVYEIRRALAPDDILK
ncbi:MAG: acetolactate synthase large subunit, partial [Deltaproteobacteria bacterium]|nr:acetolactate synthase large subunit [Deltaproteobacteria bacterium]